MFCTFISTLKTKGWLLSACN